MRVMNEKQAVALRKLVELANGNTDLVNRALRDAAHGKKAGSMDDVIEYILRHRDTPEKVA